MKTLALFQCITVDSKVVTRFKGFHKAITPDIFDETIIRKEDGWYLENGMLIEDPDLDNVLDIFDKDKGCFFTDEFEDSMYYWNTLENLSTPEFLLICKCSHFNVLNILKEKGIDKEFINKVDLLWKWLGDEDFRRYCIKNHEELLDGNYSFFSDFEADLDDEIGDDL